jgi:hypothetical protein
MSARVLLALLVAVPALAAPTRFFTLDTPATLAGSRSTGVAVRPDGGLQALPPLVPLATLNEPLAQAMAEDSQGNVYVGTGHPARLYRIGEKGAELLGELEADQITSLVVAPDGSLFATTALPATVVRFRQGKLETVATLAQGNLWDSAFFAGKLVLAAGNPGRLLTLSPKGLELLTEIPDRHARCLASTGGKLIVGTSGKGLILSYDGTNLGVLYDSGFTEIASLAAGANGTVVATALTGDPTLGQKPGEGQPSVSVSTTAPSPETGRFTSEVLLVSPQGAVTTLVRFDKELAFTVAWDGPTVLVGTGLEGRLVQVVETVTVQLDTVDAGQITRLGSGGRLVLTQEPVKVLRRRGFPRAPLPPRPWTPANRRSGGALPPPFREPVGPAFAPATARSPTIPGVRGPRPPPAPKPWQTYPRPVFSSSSWSWARARPRFPACKLPTDSSTSPRKSRSLRFSLRGRCTSKAPRLPSASWRFPTRISWASSPLWKTKRTPKPSWGRGTIGWAFKPWPGRWTTPTAIPCVLTWTSSGRVGSGGRCARSWKACSWRWIPRPWPTACTASASPPPMPPATPKPHR